MSIWNWLRAVPEIITTAKEIAHLIDWLRGKGADLPRPKLLTKAPSETQSVAVKARADAKAYERFASKAAEELARKTKLRGL